MQEGQRGNMADKELRKLKRRELLRMLLAQCEETERLQRELEEIREEYGAMAESYGRLKKKLDLKDERLNQKDAKIGELSSQLKEMEASRLIELEEAGSIAEAAIRINGVFEAAQEAAEQYLMNIRLLSEKALGNVQDAENPFGPGKISSIRKVRNLPRSASQAVPISLGKTPGSLSQVVPISLSKVPGGSGLAGAQEDGLETGGAAVASGGFYG